MKKTLRTSLCCIACTLFAASTWAQREPGSTSESQSPTSQRSSQGALGSPSQRSTSYSSSMHSQQSVRVSQVLNAQVKTQDGQQLGQIEDLIANPQTGKIEFAVVSKGEKLCPIPMQLLQSQPGAQTSTTPGTTPSATTGTQGQKLTFVAQVDRQKLEQGPSFSKTQWPQISASWSQQIYSHYGVQPEAAGGTGSSSSTQQQQGKSSSSSQSSDPSSSDTEKRSTQQKDN